MHKKIFLLATFSVCISCFVQAAEVNIYSERKEELIKPLLEKFTAETGIHVNIITGGGDILLKRLEIEGRNSPADILLTTDIARLYRAKTKDLLQPVSSEILEQKIPRNFRDSEGYWYGLSLRSRVIVYANDRVKPGELSTYEALANEKWKKRLCVRSSTNVYNQSLVASLIIHNGMEMTQQWAGQLVENFARKPKGGDRDQIKSVAIGECDIALVNTYYLGGMLNSVLEKERAIAEKVSLFWPNQVGRGAHFNISGAGITKSAQHRDAAIQLLEFFLEEDSQKFYADQNYEFPVNPDIKPGKTLSQWGNYKIDNIRLEKLGEYNAKAVLLMDRVDWK